MNQPVKSTQDPDAALADFTDRLLQGKSPPPSVDEELRGLEETVIRLERGFRGDALDGRTRAKLEAELHDHILLSRRMQPGMNWWSRQARQRVLLIAGAVTLVAILILVEWLPPGGGNVQGTTGFQPQSLALLAALIFVIFLFIWLVRRR